MIQWRLNPASWQVFNELDAFLDQGRDFLESRPAEHNLPLGIIQGFASNPALDKKCPFSLYGVEQGETGAIRAVFLQSHKAVILCGELSDQAIQVLPDLLQSHGKTPTGVVGPIESATAVAECWESLTGGPRIVHRSLERVHELRVLIAPQGVPGRSRRAEPRDTETLAQFGLEFVSEALPQEAHTLDEMRLWAVRQIELNHSWLREDDQGVPVATASISRRVPGGAAISIVYTRPEQRGKGYGAAVTAAVSQAILNEGLSFCCLYTDLANPISNRVYAKLGYQPLRDTAHLRFDWGR